jgi:hypothetical protein
VPADTSVEVTGEPNTTTRTRVGVADRHAQYLMSGPRSRAKAVGGRGGWGRAGRRAAAAGGGVLLQDVLVLGRDQADDIEYYSILPTSPL